MTRGRVLRRCALLALSAATWTGTAAACPVCFAAKSEANRLAFVGTAVFLSALPLLMVGALTAWAAYRLKRHDEGSRRTSGDEALRATERWRARPANEHAPAVE
ncbi:MAG TPA: hypothetical protein VHC69_14700 [Polyangiaceae bacterium]|nr:hypothetical protein [Polyangiaceae bacterium]